VETAKILLTVAALPLLLLTLLGLFAWRYVRFIRREMNDFSGPTLVPDRGPAVEESAPLHPLRLCWVDTTASGPNLERTEAAGVTMRVNMAFVAAGVSHIALTSIAMLGAFAAFPVPARVSVAYLAQLPGLALLLWSVSGRRRVRLAFCAIYLLAGCALVPALGGVARAIRIISGEIGFLTVWPLFGLAFLLVRRLRPIVVGLVAVVAYFVGGIPSMAVVQTVVPVSLDQVEAWQLVLGIGCNVLGLSVLVWLLRRSSVRRPVIVLLSMAVAGISLKPVAFPIGPILFAVPGNVFQWYLVWLTFKGFVRLKERRLLPDQALHFHLCCFYLTAYFSTVASYGPGQPPGPGKYTMIAMLAFVVEVVVLHLVLYRIRCRQFAAQPRRLLLLRVFGSGRRLRWLLDVLDDSWRRLGRVDLIVGPDVALRAVSARMFEAFLVGHTRRVFLNGSDEVMDRLSQLDSALDGDVRFPLNELYCRGDAWKLAVKRLAPVSDVVLMDMRRFTRDKHGCVYELTEIIRLVSLERIVLLADGETDARALEEIACQAWKNLPQTSPNLVHANPVLNVLRCAGRGADEALVVKALNIASRESTTSLGMTTEPSGSLA
jgi:hypothetical protein